MFVYDFVVNLNWLFISLLESMNSASQLQSKIANALNTASTQPPNPVWYQNVPQPTTTAIYGSKSSSSQYNKPNIFDNPSLVSTPKVQEHAQPK